ncbi:MAG: hypothetical protein ABR568_01515 [Pyrinomonadaceae bacterium]
MTNEEIQRSMGFIIKQQESFSENMELLREAQVKGESAAQARTDERLNTLINVIERYISNGGNGRRKE